MKNLYGLGNACHPHNLLRKHLKQCTVDSVFAGCVHNQILSKEFVPLYLFDYKKYNDYYDAKNWITIKRVIPDEYNFPIYADKSAQSFPCKLYFEWNEKLRIFERIDYYKLLDFNISSLSWNASNTSFYNVKYNTMYPHGDKRTSLQTYCADLERRFEEFKKISKYCFFIYTLDSYVQYSHLSQFETFLKNNKYDLNNFIYLDGRSRNISGLSIKTISLKVEDYFANSKNIEFLESKSKELEAKWNEDCAELASSQTT